MLRLLTAALALSASAAAQAWTPLPPMSTPRTAAAAAVLDGRLYVVGGQAAGGEVLRTAEVYTPGAGWAAIAPLDDPRAGARLLVLDGRLYLVGGRDDEGPEDDMDVFDPATGAWDSDRSMDEERDGIAAGLVDGRIVALGGADSDGLRGDSEAFDPAEDEWTPVLEWVLDPARAGAGSASDGAGVVVAGGFSTFGPLVSVERFAPGAGSEPLPDLPSPRGGVGLASAGGALFAVGGRDAADVRLTGTLRLGPTAPAWTSLAALPEGREDASVVALDGDLVVAGGTGAFGSVLASVLRLEGVAVSGSAAPESSELRVTLDSPSPARGTVRLSVSSDRPTVARVDVLDTRGRRLATLHDGPIYASPERFAWGSGAAPPGLYLVRVTTPTAVQTLRLTTLGR